MKMRDARTDLQKRGGTDATLVQGVDNPQRWRGQPAQGKEPRMVRAPSDQAPPAEPHTLSLSVFQFWDTLKV